MNHIYLACKHDRHTDDTFVAFTDEEKAKDQCREWCDLWIRWWNLREAVTEQPEANTDYGDWCLFFTDDYYCFVQKVEVK